MIEAVVAPPSVPTGINKPKVSLTLKTKLSFDIYDLRTPGATFSALEDRHVEENITENKALLKEINAGQIPILAKTIVVDEGAHLQALFTRMVKRLNPAGVMFWTCASCFTYYCQTLSPYMK